MDAPDKKEGILKNPLAILKSGAVFSALKKLWIVNHVNVQNPENFMHDFFDFLKLLGDKESIRPREVRNYYSRKLMEHRSGNSDLDYEKDMLAQLLGADLEDAKIILDFGCGKLAFLKNIAEQDKTCTVRNLEKLIGVDAWSRPTLDGLDSRIKFYRNLEGIADNSVDMAIIKFVLHHVENEDEIAGIFSEIKRVLKPAGKMIIFEESFQEEELDIFVVEKYLERYGLVLAREATADFLDLSPEEKIQYLFLNDWLMNMQNKYMPWTGHYKSIEEWERLGESAGFQKGESHFIGAIEKRKRKQGMTAILKFIK
jgi:SAM-dependent methyltransferase